MRGEIIEAAGGLDKNGLPQQKDNKDISQRVLLKNGRAEVLKNKIIETREQLLALVDDAVVRQQIADNIPLKINPIPEGSDKKTWELFTFQQMPVAAVLPMLSKFQNDAKLTETTILNHFFNWVQPRKIRFPKFVCKKIYFNLKSNYCS